MAAKILMNEYKALSKADWVRVELYKDNVFEWHIGLMILNPDSLYHGGYFKAKMSFPPDYPYKPPRFTFVRPVFHPNIYKNGTLCISILHPPGDDAMSGESAAERWSPIQNVESILVSIISLLDDAECSSPANVDAAVMFRNDRKGYEAQVKLSVGESKQDIPPGFVMPTTHVMPAPVQEKQDDQDFWCDSDGGDFAGSESDEEVGGDEDDDDEEMDDDEEGAEEDEE